MGAKKTKSFEKLAAEFAEVTNLDPKDIEAAYNERRALLQVREESKQTAAGVGAFGLVTSVMGGIFTAGAILGTGGVSIVGGAALLIGSALLGLSLHEFKNITKAVKNDVQKYLPAPEEVKQLPAPAKGHKPPPIKMT